MFCCEHFLPGTYARFRCIWRVKACAVWCSRQLGRKRHFNPGGDGVLEALHPLPTGFGSGFGTMQEVGRRHTTEL